MHPDDEINDLTLDSFKASFNARLERYLAEKTASYNALVTTPLILQTLDHAIALINAGGKRIRPYLCFLAYVTENGTNKEEALRISMALELFHAFALMHDDIIDRGIERHGKPTTHKYIESALNNSERGEASHIGEAMALLAGDLIFSWSYEIMTSANNLKALALFFTMIEEVVVGQMLDVSFTTKNNVTQSDIILKNELKTARYSFVNPMLIGAALAGSDKNTALYRETGLLLGQAFQTHDDLLDVIGSASTGKKTFIDIEDGQHTLLTQYVFENGNDEQKAVVRSFFGSSLSDSDRKTLLDIFSTSGAITYAEQNINERINEARHSIEHSHIENKPIWINLVEKLQKRTF